jgi:hypothetical protein
MGAAVARISQSEDAQPVIDPRDRSRIARLCATATPAAFDFRDILENRIASDLGRLYRSIAIALSRDILHLDLLTIAHAFSCRDAEEVAAHCNRVHERAAREPSFGQALSLLKSACGQALFPMEAP